MRIFPRINFLRKLFNRDAQIAAFDKDIAAAEGLADPGERFLAYTRLADQVGEQGNSLEMRIGLPATFMLLGGIITLVAAAACLNPLLAGGGLALIYGGIGTGSEVGRDALEAIQSRWDKCAKASKDIIHETPPKAFASSPVFEQLMKNSDLPEKFLRAAADEKAAPDEKVAPEPPMARSPANRLNL